MQLRKLTGKMGTRPFFPWRLYFAEVFEKGGFDIVIANPPWIQSRSLNKLDKALFLKIYTTAFDQYDLFNLFIEKAYGLCKENSNVCFITPDRFITNIDYENIRIYLLEKTALKRVIALGDGVFENVCMPSAIILFQKSASENNKVLLSSLFYGTFHEVAQDNIHHNSRSIFPVYKDAGSDSIIDKIIKGSIKFGQIVNNARGVEIGKKSDAISKVRKPGYEPFLRGEDIGKYFIRECVYLDTSHPNIDYKNRDLYKGKKILIRKTGTGINAALDEKNRFVIQVIYIFKIKQGKDYDERFLLAVLNSALMEFWYFTTFGEKERKTFPHLTQGKVLEFPIPPICLEKQRPLIALVDKIHSITKSNNFFTDPAEHAVVSDYEKQIDQLVYELYGLTPEEIAVVEGKK